MTYFIDEHDVVFNLFEWLPCEQIVEMPVYQDFPAEMQKMILAEVIKFCKQELAPLWVSGDREGLKFANGKVTTPQGYKEVYQKFAANGFIGPDVPGEWGGQGLPLGLCVAINEAIIGSNISFSLYSGLTRGAAHLIETCADTKLKNLFCNKMYSGVWAGTMCLTEPQAGSAVGEIKTSAKLMPDGTYQIRGNKIFISSGEHDLTENIIHLVLARIEGDAPGTKGISLFIVPKIWVDASGNLKENNDVNCINIEHKLGIHASATCSLNFGENNHCRGFLVGAPSQGMRFMFRLMNEARLLVGIQGLALAANAYEHAVRYAKERVQGDNTRIICYPGIKRDLALAKALVEGIRGLLYLTGFLLDQAKHADDAKTKERAQNRVDLLIPICKAYASDYGFKVTEIAMQVLGGYGYTRDYPIEQCLRDVKIASIYEGTNGIQALDLLVRKLTLKNGQLFQELYEDLTLFINTNQNHPQLSEEISAFKKAVESVAKVVMGFLEWGTQEKDLYLQAASPFLEMCGHTLVAHCLLSQAISAAKHLAISPETNTPFYKNKMLTAQFFVHNQLSRVIAISKDILQKDASALAIEF